MRKSSFRFRLWASTALVFIVISICYQLLLLLGYTFPLVSSPLPDVFAALASVMFAIMVRQLKKSLSNEPHEQAQQSPAGRRQPGTTTGLLSLIGVSEEEQENITGDLLEEFREFDSRLVAYIWLSKQVIKSVLPLAYKAAKNRVASYFREQVR